MDGQAHPSKKKEKVMPTNYESVRIYQWIFYAVSYIIINSYFVD